MIDGVSARECLRLRGKSAQLLRRAKACPPQQALGMSQSASGRTMWQLLSLRLADAL